MPIPRYQFTITEIDRVNNTVSGYGITANDTCGLTDPFTVQELINAIATAIPIAPHRLDLIALEPRPEAPQRPV